MICLIERNVQKIQRLVRNIKLKHVCIIFATLMALDISGIFIHVLETSYENHFTYPYDGDIREFVEDLKHNKKPSKAPINRYNYTYIHEIKQHCVDEDYPTLRIIFIIKSAAEHFDRRKVIRNSWGYKKRFYDVPTRTIFLLGKHEDDYKLQTKVNEEANKFNDIVQADFIDSYYNNTIKTMIGFEWAVTHCRNSKFYMFVDDDMYVSVKNVLRFIRNPASYPDYLKEPSRFGSRKRRDIAKYDMPNKKQLPNDSTIQLVNYERIINLSSNLNSTKNILQSKFILNRISRQVFDFDLPNDVRLFAGYVFISSPHRHKTSKWYVTLKEYPFDYWPPYVTAGAYILSKEALVDMYYTSFYTKHFRFDDIFLGLVAKKADIEPFHCDEFHFYRKDYTKFNYNYVITSHGYEDPDELLQVWNEQKSLGNA